MWKDMRYVWKKCADEKKNAQGTRNLPSEANRITMFEMRREFIRIYTYT